MCRFSSDEKRVSLLPKSPLSLLQNLDWITGWKNQVALGTWRSWRIGGLFNAADSEDSAEHKEGSLYTFACLSMAPQGRQQAGQEGKPEMALRPGLGLVNHLKTQISLISLTAD